jgi:PiT family inorganic phosphate transporter
MPLARAPTTAVRAMAWRIIRTLGKGLVEIAPPQGMAAEAASAAIILSSSHLGMALSTTHVATGSILGTGLGRRGAEVHWGVAGRMVVAWVITIPAAALVGAACWFVADALGGALGVGVMLAGLVAASVWMFRHSQKAPVSHRNVNEEWVDRVVHRVQDAVHDELAGGDLLTEDPPLVETPEHRAHTRRPR